MKRRYMEIAVLACIACGLFWVVAWFVLPFTHLVVRVKAKL